MLLVSDISWLHTGQVYICDELVVGKLSVCMCCILRWIIFRLVRLLVSGQNRLCTVNSVWVCGWTHLFIEPVTAKFYLCWLVCCMRLL